jgi:hypothetical protein
VLECVQNVAENLRETCVKGRLKIYIGLDTGDPLTTLNAKQRLQDVLQAASSETLKFNVSKRAQGRICCIWDTLASEAYRD